MPLKQLEIKGFKSFAKKTVLEFEPGIVAIVGPNGSGKSNLTDAVLWVLGEQSPRTLRGTSMEDVIFDGNPNHPSVSLAEVSLTLENSQNQFPLDHSEVTLTRRALRSGEGAYFINRKPCRLLDIQELLSDFSLGKELSTVVSQGQLEEILQQKPEERVVLIEEAAGVLKYKKRKIRTLRKLLSSKEKLGRAQTILREVKRQLFPLKKQATAAILRQKYLEALREEEVALGVSQLKKAQEKWGHLKVKEKKLSLQVLQSKKKLKILEEETEIFQKEAQTPSAKDRWRTGQAIKEILERAKGGLSLLKEKRGYLKHHFDEADFEIKNLEAKKSTLDKKLKKLEAEKKAAQAELEKLYFRLKTAGQEAEGIKKQRLRIEENISNLKVQKEYPKGPRALNLLRRKGVKILGTLKELMEVSEEYRPAVEAFLDSDLFCLVLESEKELTKALKTLREAQEKASLIPLTPPLAGRKPPLSPPLPPAITATQVIKNNSSLSAVFKTLLAQVYLVKDLKMALGLRAKSPEFTFVTLAREVISPSGKVRANYIEPQKLGEERENLLRKENQIATEISKLHTALGALRERQLYQKVEEEETLREIKKLGELEKEKDLKVCHFQRVKTKLKALAQFYGVLLDSLERLKVSQENLMEKEEASFKKKRKLWQENQDRAKTKTQEIERLNKELYEVNFSLSELEAEVKERAQKIVNEYGIPLEKALKEHSSALSGEETTAKINELKAKIEAIGEVNQLAVREAQILEEREKFLKGQIEDLTQSRQALKKISRAIDKRIETRFLETFTQINKKFKEIFAQIFPRGKAELVLTNEDSSWGLEIKAEPFGKRLKNISLLSGGEKALVALTLLFAVYMMRPSPFYILDEVEPALDDINLQRFLNFLEKLKKEAQFLVITHQRRTMEVADSLWGVTMQGDGVSQLISYRPSDFKPLSEPEPASGGRRLEATPAA